MGVSKNRLSGGSRIGFLIGRRRERDIGHGTTWFFDLKASVWLDEKNDSLVAIGGLAPFEAFHDKLKAAPITVGLRAKDEERKSTAGYKLWDEVLIFEALKLQSLYNLSEDQVEYQLRDRPMGIPVVGRHLGQRTSAPRRQAGHMTAADRIVRNVKKRLARKGRPHTPFRRKQEIVTRCVE